MQSLYDHPLYYDVIYGWDRDSEARFYDRVFRAHGVAAGEPLIEIACGTGQIAARLAEMGWPITGIELRPAMLRFMQQRCRERGVRVLGVCADMTAFALRAVYAAAYCPLGSFHLLGSDETAIAHLASVAAVLRPQGIYALDLTFGRALDDEDLIDDWQMERGPITVEASHAQLIATNRDSGERLDLHWGGDLRRYTTRSFTRLLERAGCFSIAAVYPEHDEADDGDMAFDIMHRESVPDHGRAIVILQR